MGISISNLISYDIVSVTLASIVLLLSWFILSVRNNNKKNQEHDKELFKQPTSQYHEDCPICFLRLPTLKSGTRYMTCCGKSICSGCDYAPVYDNQGNVVDNQKCAFCRTPKPKTDEGMIERTMKRVKLDDPIAIYSLGSYYRHGIYGLAQDFKKALEFWHRSRELGCAMTYNSIGYAYMKGEGVAADKKKAEHYYELAAMAGNVLARNNLGSMEARAGNMDRALKHYLLATEGGSSKSLKIIKELYSNGHATKDDYTTALKSYQVYLGEIKSVQRDEAAAAHDDYRYY